MTTMRLSADYQWDPNGSAAGLGGDGIWDTTNLFWDVTQDGLDDGTDITQAVAFGLGDNAIFGGSAGTVVLANDMTVSSTTFTTPGYTLNLTNTSSGTYALGMLSGAPTVNITLGSGTTTASLGATNFAGFTGILNVGVAQAAGSGKAQLNTTVGPLPATAAINVTANSTLYVNSSLTEAAPITLAGGDTGESLGQLRLEGGAIWSGAVTLAGSMAAGDSFIGSNTGGTGTISGAIGETGGSRTLSKGGAGTLTLSGTNTFSGGLTINAGRITATSTAALGSGAVTVGSAASYGAAYSSGATPFLAMTNSGTQTVTSGLVMPAPGSTSYYALQKSTAGSTLEWSGTISGGNANSILQLDTPNSGDGTTLFILSGTNTLAGQVRLNRGSVALTNASSLGTASLYVQTNANAVDGNVRFTNAFTLPNNIFIGTAGDTFNLNANNVTWSGALSGSVSWTKMGTGTLTLSGTNTHTGPTIIGAGSLTLDYTTNNTNKLSDTALLTLAPASVLTFTGNASAATSEVINGLTLGGSKNNLVLATAAGQTLTADFTGTAGTGVYTSGGNLLTITSTGTGTAQVKLPGTTANTAVVPAVVYNSAFAGTDANNYLTTGTINSTATSLSTWATGSTQYKTTGAAFTGSVGTIAINGIIFNDAAARTVAITAGSTVTTQGVLVNSVVGANLSTISGGSLQAASAGKLMIVNNDTSSGLTISSVIPDNGGSSLYKSGAGLLTLSGANTFTGGLNINLGRVAATIPGALGTGTITVGADTFYATTYASGGTPFLALTGSANQVVGNNIVLPAAAAATSYYALQKLTAGSTLELSGTLSGGGANTILQLDTPNSGDSTTSFILSGTNTLVAGTQVRLNRGCLTLANGAALGGASLFVQTNNNTAGNVRFTSPITLPNDIGFGTAANTLSTDVNDVVLSGAISSGTAAWSKIGTGSLTLSGISPAAGSMTVGAGTVKVTGTLFANAYFPSAVVTISSGAILDLKNWEYDQTTAHAASLGGLTANNPAIVINGGTIRISGTTPTSYTRGFSVGTTGATFEAATGVNWTLGAGSGSTLASYNTGASLTFTGAGVGNYNKVFSGTGGLTKSGAGVWSLGAVNTYSGTTTVSGGTLLVNGTNSGTGAVSVASTATLGGAGSIAGDVLISSGAFVAPGTTSAVGTLTVASATLAGTFNCRVNGASSDQVAVTGALTVSPGASIVVSSTVAPTASSYVIATYGSLSGSLPTVTGIPSGYSVDTSTAGQIKLVAGGGGGFAAWAAGFTGLTDSTPAGDPDHDGLSNLMEYVLGGDPRVSSSSVLPRQAIVGSNLVLSYKRNDASIADTTQTGQWSTDLTNWTDVAPVMVNDNGSAPDDMTVTVPLSNAVNGRLFVRLKVSR